MLRNFYFAILILFSFSPNSNAAEPEYTFDERKSTYEIQRFRYAHAPSADTVNELNIHHINPLVWPLVNIKETDKNISEGVNWYSFELVNSEAISKDIYLTIKNSLYLKDVALLVKGLEGDVASQPLFVTRTNKRSGRILLPPHSKKEVTFYLVSEKNISLSFTLQDANTHHQTSIDDEFFNGIAIGGAIFLSVGVLFLFFASGSKSILLLCGYFSARAIGLSVLLGGNFNYLFPESASLRGLDIPIITVIIALFLLWFSSELFSLKTKFRKLHLYIRAACWVLLVYLPISVLLSTQTNFLICLFIYSIVTFLLVVVGLMLAKQAIPLARLFTAIMLIQLLLGSVIVIGVQGFDRSLFADNDLFYSFSFLLNGMLLIFLVSRLFYVQVKEKQIAQKSALTSALQAKIAQDELLKIQEDNQEQLEIHVQQRTLELNIAFQELEELNKELAEKTTIDDLTGLNNRRFYDQKIQAEFRRSRRNLTPLSLVVLDIDHFKSVNDSFGHLVGDQCLTWLAGKLKNSLKRSTDIGCRYGGEEFCLILPETDEKGAKAIAEEFRKNVEGNIVELKGNTINLTVSCGITTYTQQADVTVETIFNAADKALYRAKQHGRNRIEINPLTPISDIQE